MAGDFAYMLGVVIVGWAVTFAYRSTPFVVARLLGRTMPPWLARFSNCISPFVIACLIVYSFSLLAWRTPWPYLAAGLTVAVQLWRRNGLMSIVAGTAAYMALIACGGCTSVPPPNIDSENPSIVVRSSGIYVDDRWVRIAEVPAILEDADIPKTRTIHMRLDPSVRDMTEARTLTGVLAASGYTRSILVTKEHGDGLSRANETYRKDELVYRAEDIMFMVTKDGVRFGLLTPIEPTEVAAYLEKYHAQHDQLIRICGQARDYQSSEVMSIMLQLEKLVREAGYTNVKRFWLDDSKPKPGERVETPGRPAAGGSRTIRYKGARE